MFKKYFPILFFLVGCAASSPAPTNNNTTLNFQRENNNVDLTSEFQQEQPADLPPEIQKEVEIKEEAINFLEERVKKLEGILAEKEKEIEELENQQQTENNAPLVETPQNNNVSIGNTAEKEELITQALEKDLGKTFSLENDTIYFEIGKNKVSQDEEQNTNLHQQALEVVNTQDSNDYDIQQQILSISLETVQPSDFRTPPQNPIPLKKIKGAEDLYKKGYNNYSKKNFSQAIHNFHQYIDRYKTDTAIDNAIFWIGMSYWHMENLELAQKYFIYILQNFEFLATNRGGKTSDSLIMLGRILETTRIEDSKQYYQLVINLYPNSTAAKRASSLIQKLN